MKTLQQRLQSRISRRRNVIREVEADRALGKELRKMNREVMEMFGLFDPRLSQADADLSEGIHAAREVLAGLTEDQKLDKALKNVLTNMSRMGILV